MNKLKMGQAKSFAWGHVCRWGQDLCSGLVPALFYKPLHAPGAHTVYMMLNTVGKIPSKECRLAFHTSWVVLQTTFKHA